MSNNDNLPTWDEIFTNLDAEIARYDANLAWMNARFAAINERIVRDERVMRNAARPSSKRNLKTYR